MDDNNRDSGESRFEKTYRKREIDSQLENITGKIDELKDLAKKNLKEARITNGRVTTLEEEVEELQELPDKVDENTNQIAYWKGAIQLAAAALLPLGMWAVKQLFM